MSIVAVIGEYRLYRIPLHHRRPGNPASQVILGERRVTGYASAVVGRQRHVPAAVGAAVGESGIFQQCLQRFGGFRRGDLPGLGHHLMPELKIMKVNNQIQES